MKYLAEDVFWLKVPHHGSERNISNEMIEKIKPKEAYISTEKYGHYLDKDVVNALTKARCRIYCTKDGTSFLHKGFTEHNDYHSVEPMKKETLEKQDKRKHKADNNISIFFLFEV